VRNPFQSADLRDLQWWRGVTLHDEENPVFDELTRGLEDAFCKAVANGGLTRFGREYDRVAQAMVARLPGDAVLAAILEHAFRRLVTIYCYLRQRRQSQQAFLEGSSSVVRWKIEQTVLAKAIEQADRMQQSGVTHQKFDLKSSPKLLGWIFGNYWPLVRKFCGPAALPIPNAHVRCLSHDKDGGGYRDRFRHHPFGNHHFDEDVYSLPLIIYLSDVSQDCGPFEYLSASDQYSHNFVLRAFHQALNHDCGISSLDEKSFPVFARLPAVFRGGDVIGNLYPQTRFEDARPVSVNGEIGTAVLFDGFNTVHAGGFPSAGYRKSLFVNFRFPVAKLVPRIRLMFLRRDRTSKTGLASQP
jgi:hypothetical protein